jgi:hypothetical protein
VLKEKQIGFLVKLFACKKVCVNLVKSRGKLFACKKVCVNLVKSRGFLD